MAITAYKELQSFTIGDKTLPMERVREHPQISLDVMQIFKKTYPPLPGSSVVEARHFDAIPFDFKMKSDGCTDAFVRLTELQENETCKNKTIRLLKVAFVAAILAASILTFVFTWGTPLVGIGFILYGLHVLAAVQLSSNEIGQLQGCLGMAELIFSLCGGTPFFALYHILAKTRLSRGEEKLLSECNDLQRPQGPKEAIQKKLTDFFNYYKDTLRTVNAEDLATNFQLHPWDVRKAQDMLNDLEKFYVRVGALTPLADPARASSSCSYYSNI